MTEELGPPVAATRVSARQLFHPRDTIGLRRLDHPMKMIRPEDRGVNLPIRLGANLAQRLDEALAIRIIHENPFAPVTAIHDVINRASTLDSQLAGLAGRGALVALHINSKNCPLYRADDSAFASRTDRNWTSKSGLEPEQSSAKLPEIKGFEVSLDFGDLPRIF